MVGGAYTRLHDTDGEDLGFAHLPEPVEKGDVIALRDGSTWRIVRLIDLRKLGTGPLRHLEDAAGVVRAVDMLCMVERADTPSTS